MNVTARYFIDLLKSRSEFSDCNPRYKLVFKNFWTDKHGCRIWTPADIVNDMETKKTVIVGLAWEAAIFTDYITASSEQVPVRRSHSFEYSWREWGTFDIYLDDIKDGPLTKFLESIFMQMLLLSDQGYNIFLNNSILLEKNTSYNHLMNIDMMSAVE